MMLKKLLDIAKNELHSLSTFPNPGFRLEQVEYKKGEGVYDVIVSYLVEHTNKRVNKTGDIINPVVPLITPEFQYHRLYKRLTINNNKKVEGLYMYNN